MAENVKGSKLPMEGKRNILITSALPYVNNVPHLGNIIGCVLSADVFARYCRLRGYNAIYICGTDEYGTATETKAMEENCSPKEICDKYHAIHKEVYNWFNISFDEFGRTSCPQQTEMSASPGITVKLCIGDRLIISSNLELSIYTCKEKTADNNLFLTSAKVKSLKQWSIDVFVVLSYVLYCDSCERFLADRLVEGTCPTQGCKYDSARGDQCEKCGKLLNPTELKNPRCKVCEKPPRIRDTDHLFLELPLLKDRLEKYISEMSVVGGWSQNAIQTTNSWLREGLRSRCITRDLKWGVSVPHEKYSDKVFYVWFDAPIGYVSITSCYTRDWEKWWKNPENVELYQFMGKDNVPFHTVSDTLFTWPDLQAKLNSELLNNLGNFIHRVLSFIAKPAGRGYDSVIPSIPDDVSGESHIQTKIFADKVVAYIDQYIEAMEKVKLKQGLKTAMSISSEGNAYLQEAEFWRLYKENRPLCSLVMKTAVGIVYLLACLLEPFIPSFTREVFKQLNLPAVTHVSLCQDKGDIDRVKRPWDIISAGHKIGTPEPLFRELKDEEVEFYRKKFAGSQADRTVRAEAEAENVAGQLKKTKLSIIGKEEISLNP
ncbi:Methionine--tRNA ligase, cytoplasmic [Glycine soja]|uniref:methionine--tRNA ligase n=1 Tax=Glycine soja TaxID=3848 RepID=A0A445H9N2_GLYSO|nr:Methionine--tRNA ligase, cytoplasmic [Glycine soja]